MSVVEGVSLLVLLFVAMPLKYIWHYPLAVRVVGSLHGALFLLLLAVVLKAAVQRVVSLRLGAAVAALSVVPFGFVLAERMLRETPTTRA